MTLNPIMPIWLMAIVCIGILALKRKGSVMSYVRQILIVVLIFVINLRLMIPNGEYESTIVETNTYVLFVIDNTISMYAVDYDANGTTRREGIQADCAYIMDQLPGAHYAAIGFDNDARVLSPFTDNAEFEKSVIQSMVPLSYYYAEGTTLNTAYQITLQKLQQLDEDFDGAQAVVFFMTDGENTSDEKLQSFDELAKYIDNGAVLGYGTTTGAKMYAPVSNYSDETTTIHDEHYNDAISCMDEDTMKKLAKDMKIEYIHMTKSSDVDSVIAEVKETQENLGNITKTLQGYDDIYYYFAIPLALLLVWEVLSTGVARNHKKNKQGVKADAPQA